MLFEDKPRNRTAPMKDGEREFDFYDSSARPEYTFYRQLLNGWIAELPLSEREEMISRLKKGTSLEYQSALSELTIHAALKRQGCSVEIHPLCEHPTRRPDFLARNEEGERLAFIEVTSFRPAAEEVSNANLRATVINALDSLGLPGGRRLGVDILDFGTRLPNLRKLGEAIKLWAGSVDAISADLMPTREFEQDDWTIELTLFRKLRGQSGRTIVSKIGKARYLSAETEIRSSLKKKGGRYGRLGAPYLVVIADCKDELGGGKENAEALLEAVFGTVVTEAILHQDGQTTVHNRRMSDGYWGAPGSPKHQGVSGVLLLPRPHLWDLRSDRWQPILVRNPWADFALPTEFLALPGYCLTDSETFMKTDGISLADILGIPEVWPPE